MHFIFISFKMHRKGIEGPYFKALLKVFVKNLFEAMLSFCHFENIAYKKKNPFFPALSGQYSAVSFMARYLGLWQQWYGILHTL